MERPPHLAPLSEEERVVHFLSRFTLGPTPALVQQVGEMGIEKWLDAQLASGREGPRTGGEERRWESLESLAMTNREVLDNYVLRVNDSMTEEERKQRRRLRGVPARELRDSVLLRGVYSGAHVHEVLADFFRNHFCVAVDKGRVRYFASEYEREVLRPGAIGALGPFREFLGATAKHPAMLEYLDNHVSRRPPTKAELKKIELKVRAATKSKEQGKEASDIAAQRGLNENYARELLELHTLGVDNYYTQDDVENVALALTGWSIQDKDAEPVTFLFRPEMHSTEDKKVLRKVIHKDRKEGVNEGEEMLDILARHRGTAHFIAWKLCRHFVNDDPDEKMVERIAKVFSHSKGDLPLVYRAIVADDEFFAPRNYRAKFKRPFEFVTSALRATGADVQGCRGLHRALKAMNEDVYLCDDPTGYYDQAEAWLDPGAFALRWKFARDLISGRIEDVSIPEELWSDVGSSDTEDWIDNLSRRVLPGGVGARTRSVLDGMARRYFETHFRLQPQELCIDVLGVILGSPEFQEQ